MKTFVLSFYGSNVTGTKSDLSANRISPTSSHLAQVQRCKRSASVSIFTYLAGMLALALTISAVASTRYVSPTGDDITGDGSFDRPYRTFNRLLANVVAGDEIVASQGNYNEALNIPPVPLTFRSQSGIVSIEPPPCPHCPDLGTDDGTDPPGNKAPRITAAGLAKPIGSCDTVENWYGLSVTVWDEKPESLRVVWSGSDVTFKSDTGTNTSAKFGKSGPNRVTVTVRDAFGAQASRFIDVHVPKRPVSYLTEKPEGICLSGGVATGKTVLLNTHPKQKISFKVKVTDFSNLFFKPQFLTGTVSPAKTWPGLPCGPHTLWEIVEARFADCPPPNQATQLYLAVQGEILEDDLAESLEDPIDEAERIPRITNAVRLADGSIELEILSDIIGLHIVEVSSDMRTWTPFKSIICEGQALKVIDDEVSQEGLRFYRVKF